MTPLPYQDSSDMTGALHGHYPRKPLRRGIPKAAGCRAEDTCVTGFPDLRVYVTAKHCWLPAVHRLQGLTGDERSDTFSNRLTPFAELPNIQTLVPSGFTAWTIPGAS